MSDTRVEVVKVNPSDPESLLTLLDKIFSELEILDGLEVLRVLVCSSIASTVSGIIDKEKRYAKGEEGLKLFYESALEAYRKGREKADMRLVAEEAAKAKKH